LHRSSKSAIVAFHAHFALPLLDYRRSKIFRLLIPCAVVALLSACASTPASTADTAEKPRVACDDEPRTGTMLKRCNQGEVRTISKEEIDRVGGVNIPVGGSAPGGTR